MTSHDARPRGDKSAVSGGHKWARCSRGDGHLHGVRGESPSGESIMMHPEGSDTVSAIFVGAASFRFFGSLNPLAAKSSKHCAYSTVVECETSDVHIASSSGG